MDIEFISSLEKFKAEVERLSGIIILAKENRIAELLSRGHSTPIRVSHEELDLHEYMSDLLCVHKTLQWRAHNENLSNGKKSARAVALAGICELIKAEYLGNFWDIYRKHIGWGADSTCYDFIWEKAFKEAGIDLIMGRGGYRREFVQTLVLESGISKKGRKTVIDFFILYWRYFRHQQDVEKLINAILENSIDLSFIPDHDRRDLAGLCKSAAEFSTAFSRAVEKLKKVFAYVENSEDVLSGDLSDYIETIYKETGVDIGDVLRGENQLRYLYERILGLVTPEKLKRILRAAVPGTRIAVPNGTIMRADEYEHVIYGDHKLRDATFSCVPTLSYTVADLKSLAFNTVIRDGNELILKSRSKIYPVVNGKDRPDLVSSFYARDRLGGIQYCGNVFHGTLYPATTIEISTGDALVRESFSELDGFSCYPTFQHLYKNNKHQLFLYFPSFRLKAAELAKKEISLITDSLPDPLFDVQLDQYGFGAATDQQVLLPKPEEGVIRIWAADSGSTEPIEINGNTVEMDIPLESALLFPSFGNRQFPIRPKHSSSRIGSKSFLLFLSKNEDYSVDNMAISAKDECGGYRVLTIEWEDVDKACQIAAGNREWKFEHCVDLNLSLKKSAAHSIEFLELDEKQGTSPQEFELCVYPLPNERTREELFWNIVVNNNDPVRVRFAKGPKGISDGRMLKFPGKEIGELIESSWKATGQGNVAVEVSLSTSDLVFNSVRFWLLPEFKVKSPGFFHDGDEVILQFQQDPTSTIQSVQMRDNRGRSRASLRLESRDGRWIYLKKEFSGSFDIKQLGTVLNFKIVPIVQGIYFGSKRREEISGVRSLLKRELQDTDLLISPKITITPLLAVNGQALGIKADCSSELTWIALNQIESAIKDRENKVEVKTGKISANFSVKHDLEIDTISFHEYLIGDCALGKVSFTGPKKSAIYFKVYRDAPAGSTEEVASYQKECDGKYHQDYAVNIPIPPMDPDNPEAYKIKLVLMFDKDVKTESLEYGETWVIKPHKELDKEDYEYLKEDIVLCLKEGRCFDAQKCLKMAAEVAPAEDEEWIEQVRARVGHKIKNVQIQSVATQTFSVLHRYFLD